MNPWILESSSSKFESYLSGCASSGTCVLPSDADSLLYSDSVFLSSIAGVLISHFYVVAGRKIKVDDLYSMEGCYRYTYGINFRAYAAYIAGIASEHHCLPVKFTFL